MIHIANILCPVDFSEFSQRALHHAEALAHWYGARLTILQVFVNRPAMDLPPVTMSDADRGQIMADMKRFAGHLRPEVPLDLRVREGTDIHREILSEAKAIPADLLVMGSHGRSGFERLLLGSVTERVIRQAPCPTMVVPRRAADAAPDEPVRFRRILCPVDFSEGSICALRYAMSLAEEADAKLMVLHVIEVPPEVTANPISGEFDVDRVRAAAEAQCRKRLQDLVPDSVPTYCTVETAVREGAAYREILKEAANYGTDLIVMGTQGRGAIDRLVFGSNTARVMRAAACPALIVAKSL